jgi:hypothetical protein
MNKKILLVLAIIIVIILGYFVLEQRSKISSQEESGNLSVQSSSEVNLPTQTTNTNTQEQSSLLQPPKITAYQGGFVKIEIPLNKNIGDLNKNIIKLAMAETAHQTYEIYRSTDNNNNFTKIATVTSSEETDYLAVFDKDFPQGAKTLSYQYARLDNNQPTYSAISTADLQKAVDEGHQPWRLDPLMVTESDGQAFYGFLTSCEYAPKSNGNEAASCDTYKLIFQAASAGVAEVEVDHNGKIFLVELIQPIPGAGKIWMIREIKETTK